MGLKCYIVLQLYLDQRDGEDNSVLAIDKDKFSKLITALRTTYAEIIDWAKRIVVSTTLWMHSD